MTNNFSEFLSFSIQTYLIWTILFSIYKIFIGRSKWVILNRCILYFILIFPFLIPFIEVNTLEVIPQNIINIDLDPIYLSDVNSTINKPGYNFSYLYIIIGIVIGLRSVYQIVQIQKLKSPNAFIYKNETFYLLKEHTAFNFLNNLFIGEDLVHKKAILEHEIVHKKAKHTVDILIVNGLQAIFWLYPFWFWIKKLFKENHEYYVDKRILKHTKLSDYLKQISLAGPFKFEEQFGLSSNQMSIFKTRLQMMKKNHKSQFWRYSLLLIGMGTVIIACEKNETDPKIIKPGEKSSIPKPDSPPLPINPSNERSISFSEVDVYPQFKGCLSPDATCFQQEMMKFISQNFKYPEKAKANNVEGKAYVGFNFSTTGEVTNIALRRKTNSKELNDEAIRLVKMLPNLTNPAMVNGKPVAISYTLPINFKIKR